MRCMLCISAVGSGVSIETRSPEPGCRAFSGSARTAFAAELAVNLSFPALSYRLNQVNQKLTNIKPNQETMNRIIQKEPTERHGKFKTGFNRWTVALASAGLVSIGSVVQAEETPHQVLTALSSTTLSGYVNTSAIWKLGTGTQLVGRAFDGTAKQDGINLDVVKLSLKSPWMKRRAAGYKVDLLFGPDAVA